MKTPAEIAALKDNWRADACWDIEDTEGFEDHYDELLAYRKEWEARWEQRRYERLAEKAMQLGIPDNMKLAVYIENIEERIETLQREIYRIKFPLD